MLSNHNTTNSSFRIIEPKRFQQAQQMPVKLSSQQIPVLSTKNDDSYATNNVANFNYPYSAPTNNMNARASNNFSNNYQQQQQQHQQFQTERYQQQQQQQSSNNPHQFHPNQQYHQPAKQHPNQHHSHHNPSQNQHHPHPHHRSRNLSDTDSSYIPGSVYL